MSSRLSLTAAVGVGLLLGVSLSYGGRVLAERALAPAGAATPAPAHAAAAGADGGTGDAAQALPLGDAQLFARVLERVRADYVDPVDDHRLMMAAIRGMVESLDPHSTFLSSGQFQDMMVTTSGAYAGIGVEVAAAKDGVSILRRMPGSPAERAGIRAGDVIVGIDGVAVDPTRIDAAIDRMRGPVGSPIRLTVRRQGTAVPLTFEVRRADVTLVSVRDELLTPRYGYVRITSFTDSTARELESAVDRLEHAGPRPLAGLIIDLRDNPGGVLDAAVQIADDFLDHGTIVSARGRAQDATFRITARPGDIAAGSRLVLIVNGGSASAAEILAAALHDNGRARLIGRRTYGKGTVQTIMPFGEGLALKLTTSRYYTPDGRSINGVGIVPDVVLGGQEQPPADMDPPVPAAGGQAGRDSRATAAREPTLAERDPQVAAALGLLEGRGPEVARAAAAAPAAGVAAIGTPAR